MEKGKYNILNFKLYYIIQGKIEEKKSNEENNVEDRGGKNQKFT